MNHHMLIALLLFASTCYAADDKKDEEKKADEQQAMLTYEDHVKPILREKCFSCHNPDKRSGDLDLTNFTNMMVGGGSGEVILPGDAESSYLHALVAHQDEPYMPPESPKLPDEMVAKIRDWIDGGAAEHAGSKITSVKKPTFEMVVSPDSIGKPAVAPSPARMSMEPVVRAQRSTAVRALAANPWTPLVAVAGQQQVALFDLDSMQLHGVLPFPEGEPHVLKFSRNGNLLLAGGGRPGASGRVVVWNLATAERVIEIGDELDAVLGADISADHSQIALGGPQRVVRVYSTQTGELQFELRKHTDWIYSVEFSPDGVLLASSDRSGGLHVWESATGREYLTLEGHSADVTDVSWRADSNVLASSSEDGTVRLWEMEDGRQIKNWRAHAEGVAAIQFTRDGRLLSCGRDRQAKIWDQNGKQLRAFERFDDLAVRVAFCDQTDRVIAGDWTGEIRIWQAKDGRRLSELTSNPPSLGRRMVDAVEQLSGAKLKQQSSQAEYDKAQKAAERARASLAAAQKKQRQMEQNSEANKNSIAEARQAIARLTKSRPEITERIQALENVVALLQEAANKADEAANALDDEQQTSEIAEQIRDVAEARDQQLDEARVALSEATANLKATREKLTALEKRVSTLAKQLDDARKQVQQLLPSVKSADEKAITAKQAHEEALRVVAVAAASVEKWQSEIEFTEQLSRLAKRLQDADEQVVDRLANQARQAAAVDRARAAVENAQQALLEAQSIAKEAESEVAGANNQVQQIRDRITRLRTTKP